MSTGRWPQPLLSERNYLPNSLFSKYNALQAQLRRTLGDLTLEANYTWSHEMDDQVNVFAGFEDPLDPRHDIGNGDWDVRNNITASAVYNFPRLEHSSSLLREAIGGWQASSILQARSGLGQNVEVTSGFFGNFMRPDVVPGVPVKLPNVSWPNSSYNINAFAMNPNSTESMAILQPSGRWAATRCADPLLLNGICQASRTSL